MQRFEFVPVAFKVFITPISKHAYYSNWVIFYISKLFWLISGLDLQVPI